MKKLLMRQTATSRIRTVARIGLMAALVAGLGLLATVRAAALIPPAAMARTMTRVLTQMNEGNPNLRGGIQIDIEVDPGNLVGFIRDLHLMVATSQHSKQLDVTLEGDRMAENYRDRTANMPTGWEYAGLIAVANPNKPGELMWYATWRDTTGQNPLGKGTAMFSLLYLGPEPAVEQPGTLVITDTGNLDPRMGRLGVFRGHAPK